MPLIGTVRTDMPRTARLCRCPYSAVPLLPSRAYCERCALTPCIPQTKAAAAKTTANKIAPAAVWPPAVTMTAKATPTAINANTALQRNHALDEYRVTAQFRLYRSTIHTAMEYPDRHGGIPSGRAADRHAWDATLAEYRSSHILDGCSG